MNADVKGLVTVDNATSIIPFLQGTDNLTYVNTDVYGEFALAGSIFMDSRNDPGFADLYTLLYGHHMEGGRMFGDLDLFKEKKLFDENRTGTLMLPDRVCQFGNFRLSGGFGFGRAHLPARRMGAGHRRIDGLRPGGRASLR